METISHNIACRLCRSTALNAELHFDRVPRNISCLLESGQTPSEPIELTVFRCQTCDFVQLDQYLGDSFYTDYLMTVSHSPQMNQYMREQVHDFVNRFELRDRRVVDVGCGDGNYLRHLQEAGTRPVGVEPSARFRELAQARGYTVHAAFINKQSPIPDAPFDGFVTRQVLEHVPDIHGFVQGIRQLLTPDGVGLVEVPRVEKSIEAGRFYDFFPDHVNYFTSATLRIALETNGFDVVEIRSGMSGEYHEAFVRARRPADLSSLADQSRELIHDLGRFVQSAVDQKKRIAIWGAGGKGLSLLAAARLNGISFVIDSDPHKQGRWTPVSQLPIVSPQKLKTDPVDVVIVTAMAYRREIVIQLREQFGFRGQIVTLGRRLELEV